MFVLACQGRVSSPHQVAGDAKSVDGSYISELEVGANAKYTSHRMIDEFVSVLSDSLEQELLSKVRASPSIGFMRQQIVLI